MVKSVPAYERGFWDSQKIHKTRWLARVFRINLRSRIKIAGWDFGYDEFQRSGEPPGELWW